MNKFLQILTVLCIVLFALSITVLFVFSSPPESYYPRWKHFGYALISRNSWQECHFCLEYFGGHEITENWNTITYESEEEKGSVKICPICQASVLYLVENNQKVNQASVINQRNVIITSPEMMPHYKGQ